MTRFRGSVVLLIAAALCGAAVGPAEAAVDFQCRLFARNEVPALSTFGNGLFKATLNDDRNELAWELTYTGLQGTVTQSHIHFAQAGVNGGIMVFLCSNLGNGPVGTQACPQSGTISGVAHAVDVGAGANAQSIPPGSFFEFSRAVLQGVAYANLHSDVFPGGEIRCQIARVESEGEGAETPAEE
jgi:CHRD domain-containing protein